MTAQDGILKRFFLEEVKRTGDFGLEVWDPVRKKYSVIVSGSGNKLKISPSKGEVYPISLDDAMNNRYEYIKRLYSLDTSLLH